MKALTGKMQTTGTLSQGSLGRRRGLLVTLLLALAARAALGGAFLPGAADELADDSVAQTSLVASVQPDPGYIELGLGGTGSVSISALSVVDLYAVQLSLGFDPALVQVMDADPIHAGVQVGVGSIISGPYWNVAQNSVNNVAGTISIFASLSNPETWFDGSGTLIEAMFLGSAAGTSPLTLTEVILSDRFGMGLPVESSDGTIVVLSTPVTPTETPTPTHTPTATETPTPLPTATATPTTGAIIPVLVEISPDNRQTMVGSTTTVDIRIVDALNLYGAQIHILYDPTVVRIVDASPITIGVQISPGSFPYPDYVGLNSADNISGTLDFAVTQSLPRAPVNGTGVMGTITFEGLQGGISPVTISSTILSDPDGFGIYSTTSDGQIEVLPGGTIVGQVLFQGRSTPPAVGWSCPLSVTLFAAGDTLPTYTFAPTCDYSGTFTITQILTDTYDVKVRDLHSLWSVRRDISVTMGTHWVSFATLVEGDSDLNAVINILDFSLLAGAFGSAPPDPVFDPRVDLNNSFGIDILDFSLLASNYGRSGEVG